MQATNSQHALAVANRKFYWNSIENYFEPMTNKFRIVFSEKDGTENSQY